MRCIILRHGVETIYTVRQRERDLEGQRSVVSRTRT
jgi:hypothetical protein